MTESTAHPNRPFSDSGAQDEAAPSSAAQLLTQITRQLSSQLSQVTLSAAASAPRRPAPALVAVAHGSRDPEALHTVRALLDRVRALRPELEVRLGHIELNEPLL